VQAEHRRKILIGFAGAVPAACTVGLVFYFTADLFCRVPLPLDTAGDRLAFVARWMLLPGLSLLLGVIFAARRGFYAEAIDGTRTPANYAMEINLRYNTNTLEQTLLAAIAWTALAVTIPISSLLIIPAMACLFFLGRMVFWIGYLIHPMGRAFGMALTMLPILVSYAWLALRLTD
jgi:MAPEG family protein